MSSNASYPHENIFSSVISDFKSYNGMDPLLPWLGGIRKMKEILPPQLLKQKLPHFHFCNSSIHNSSEISEQPSSFYPPSSFSLRQNCLRWSSRTRNRSRRIR